MKTRLRIAYLITDLEGGGAETVLFYMLHFMDRERFEPVVISLMDRGKFGDAIEQMGIPVHTIGLGQGRVSPAAFFRLVKILRAARPHVIHGWMYHANLAAQLAGIFVRVPVCSCIHSSLAAISAEKPMTRLVVRLSALMSRRAAKVVYVSHVSRVHHEQVGFAPGRGCVIPNGIDTDLFRPSASARQGVREELGLSPDTLLVGLIGRYHPQKDHPNFLHAAAIVARKWPEVRFVLAGLGIHDGNADLAELVRALDLGSRVHLLGERNDMPRVTAALDIATSSSNSEALALALVEAMACEIPCVVTDVGDSGLLVGDTGAIVPPGNPEAFAAGLDRLLSAGPGKRREFGKAARIRVEEGYGVRNSVREYEELYLSLN